MHQVIRDQLPITAHHEAAHAVAFWWKGLTFRYVTIRGRYAVGQVVAWGPRRVRLWDQAAIVAAGPIAELHFLGRHLDDEEVVANIDEEVEFAESEGSEEGGDLLAFSRVFPREMWLSTWRGTELMITATLWPAVVAVADALLSSPRALRHPEVAAVAAAALSIGT